MGKHFLLLTTGALAAWQTILAQDAPAPAHTAAEYGLSTLSIVSTLLYGLIGLVLYVAGYFLFDKLMNLDLRRELVVDQNQAVGVMMAGVFIGIAIIITAAMK